MYQLESLLPYYFHFLCILSTENVSNFNLFSIVIVICYLFVAGYKDIINLWKTMNSNTTQTPCVQNSLCADVPTFWFYPQEYPIFILSVVLSKNIQQFDITKQSKLSGPLNSFFWAFNRISHQLTEFAQVSSSDWSSHVNLRSCDSIS